MLLDSKIKINIARQGFWMLLKLPHLVLLNLLAWIKTSHWFRRRARRALSKLWSQSISKYQSFLNATEMIPMWSRNLWKELRGKHLQRKNLKKMWLHFKHQVKKRLLLTKILKTNRKMNSSVASVIVCFTNRNNLVVTWARHTQTKVVLMLIKWSAVRKERMPESWCNKVDRFSKVSFQTLMSLSSNENFSHLESRWRSFWLFKNCRKKKRWKNLSITTERSEN